MMGTITVETGFIADISIMVDEATKAEVCIRDHALLLYQICFPESITHASGMSWITTEFTLKTWLQQVL